MEDRIDDLIKDNNSEIEESRTIRLKYAAHDIWFVICNFFMGERQEQYSKDSFTEIALTILLKDNIDKDSIEASRKLLEQQRMQEDTKARRRLERWVTRIISWYLLIVLLLVIFNGILTAFSPKVIFITNSMMIVILTTTTINVIGLGLIVLRGHFPQNKNKEV